MKAMTVFLIKTLLVCHLLDLYRGAEGTLLSTAVACNKNYPSLDFVLVDGDAVSAAVEDDIRRDLQEIGLQVNTIKLAKDDWNAAVLSGDFHFAFSETWGNPYDPHSYASGWIDGSGGEGSHQAFANFEAPSSREELYSMIRAVLTEEDRKKREAQWKDIHAYYHKQAVLLPLWGKRIPTLLNARLTGYEPGSQQFDYPVHRLAPIDGNPTMTISPGSQTGLFKTVGRLDPHTYRPNEFFANNWVYEGLVSYGQNGQIIPALAKTWTIADTVGGPGETFSFQLREGVSFHDGTPWNCAAAKLNFDHVFAGALRTTEWHGWYGLPLTIDSWECIGDMEFVVTTKSKYASFLQELTYIRPLRMLSPAAFVNGSTTDAHEANSCHVGFGSIEHEDHETVNCAGIRNISGTGPFQFSSREVSIIVNEDDSEVEVDDNVIFVRNGGYWGGEPAIETLTIQRYESSQAVKQALIAGDLDAVWGSGVLSDQDIAEIRDSDELQDQIKVFHTEAIQNVIMLLNSGKPPLDDIKLRKIVIHAINKAAIVERELQGLQSVVDNVFPLESPYSNVQLAPRWDYDLEKAALLSCMDKETNMANMKTEVKDNSKLAMGLGVGLGTPLILLLVGFLFYLKKTKGLEAQLGKNSTAVEA